MKNKAVFLDRDGIINIDKGYLYKHEEIEWMPGVREALEYLEKEKWLVFVVTNQSGIARGYYTEKDVVALHAWMQKEFKKWGGHIQEFFYCPHLEGALVKKYNKSCDCRKPKPGMIVEAMEKYNIDRQRAFLFGDSPRDIEAAVAAGIQGFLFSGGNIYTYICEKLTQWEDSECLTKHTEIY